MVRGSAKQRAKAAGGKGTEAADPSDLLAVQKFLTIDAEWSKKDFPEVYDVLFWLRVFLAFIAGLAFGFYPIPAPAAFFTFATVVFAAPYLYVVRVVGLNEEEFGQMNLLTEGGGPCFGLFILSWTATFTLAQNHELGI